MQTYQLQPLLYHLETFWLHLNLYVHFIIIIFFKNITTERIEHSETFKVSETVEHIPQVLQSKNKYVVDMQLGISCTKVMKVHDKNIIDFQTEMLRQIEYKIARNTCNMLM